VTNAVEHERDASKHESIEFMQSVFCCSDKKMSKLFKR